MVVRRVRENDVGNVRQVLRGAVDPVICDGFDGHSVPPAVAVGASSAVVASTLLPLVAIAAHCTNLPASEEEASVLGMGILLPVIGEKAYSVCST